VILADTVSDVALTVSVSLIPVVVLLAAAVAKNREQIARLEERIRKMGGKND
jgi:heme exporter protein D